MHLAQKWMYFPIPVRYKFRTWQSLEAPSSSPGRDRHVHPLSFLWKIELSTTFTCNVFWFNRYFLQHSVLKWIYFPNQYIIIFQTWECLEPLELLSWGKYTYAPTELFVANLLLNNFYLKHFLIQKAYFLQCSALKWIYFPILVK